MTKLFDTSVKIEVRLFLILAWTSIIANSVGFLSNVIFYGFTVDTIFYGACALLMIIIGAVGEKAVSANAAACIILAVINIVEFPIMYYLYGAGRIVYMILGIVGIMVFCKKSIRIYMAVLAMVYDVAIMILSVVHPSTYLDITAENDIGAAVVSFVIVVISMVLILVLIVEQYEMQNRKLLQMTEELQDMAHRDPLTHLYNRRYLTDYLEPLMAERDSAFSVVLLDLDDFKQINDRYGHVFGDEVLQNFAQAMEHAMEGHGISARFGGEEFMLVIRSTDEAAIESIMAQIREEFETFSMNAKDSRFTFSGGVEMFHNEDRITQLFNAADEKLYLAKERGKNRVLY